MNRKLGRYCKRVIAFVSAFVVFFAGIYLTSFHSEAVGQSENLTFHVNYTEPYCSEYCGYFSVVYGEVGNYRLNTFFWSIVPDEVRVDDPKDFVTVMDVQISGGTIKFMPFVLGGNYYFNLYEFGSTDSLAQDMTGYYNYANNPTWSYNYGQNIVAYTFGGNVADVSAPSLNTPVIKWNNATDAIELYDYLYQILSALNRVDIDTSDIIINLAWIYNQNITTNEKLSLLHSLLAQQLVMINDELDAIWFQLDDLLKEQEESNTWLEKIYNKIVEALGLQGEESTEKLPDEEVGSVLEEEDKLMQDTTDAENSLDFSVDSNSNNVVWNVIERVLNANPRVFGAFIGIMTLGVITLLLNR